MNCDSRRTIFENIDTNKKIENYEMQYVHLIKLESSISLIPQEFFIAIDQDGRLLCTNCDGYKVIKDPLDYFMMSPIFDFDYKEVNRKLYEMNIRLEDILDIKELMSIVFLKSPYWSEKAYKWLNEIAWLKPCDFKNELEYMSKSSSHTRGFQNQLKKELETCYQPR